MNEHCMVDIETLGTTNDCVILSVGVVVFNSEEIRAKHYAQMDINHQMEEGRIIDPNTLKWWSDQDEPIPLKGDNLRGNLKDIFWGDRATYWERGNFDYRILEHYLGDVPWKFYQIRDHRTVIPKMPKTNTHNALEDAVAQVECLLNSNYNLETGCA